MGDSTICEHLGRPTEAVRHGIKPSISSMNDSCVAKAHDHMTTA